MEIEINKVVEKTKINISLPFYTTNGVHFFKVFSDSKCLCVCTLEGYEKINTTHSLLAFENNWIEVTSNDFKKAFKDTLAIIKKL